MNSALAAPENRFVTSASWEEYLKFLDAVGDRPIHITYDRGNLELMSPSGEHERVKKWMASLVESLLSARGIDFVPGGSTTFLREDLQRGLEPDECYWIANFEAVRRLPQLDLYRDPPPDLVIEVDISRSSINRIELYRLLRVPEVWRYRKMAVEVHHLQEDGSYKVDHTSRIFSDLPMSEFSKHLEMAREDGVSRAMRAFIAKFSS